MKNTIKEVAQRANVSISTVSRVFNHTAFVDETTRERVLHAAKDLHYTPNQAARSLTKNVTKTIGLIFPGLSGEYFSEILLGMDKIASDDDFDIMISGSKSNGTKFEKSIRAMSGRIDGLIVMSPVVDASVLHELLPRTLPAVLMDAKDDYADFDTVNVNNRDGAFAAVSHLIRLRHRRIALISGPEHSYDALARKAGYLHAMRSNGLDEFVMEANGSFTKASGYAAAVDLLSRTEQPTALFVSNDAMALGAISALQEHGISVPADIAIVGFDDIPMAQFANPKLSTIRTDLKKFGEVAMKKILQAVREKELHRPEHILLDFDFIIRASCGGK